MKLRDAPVGSQVRLYVTILNDLSSGATLHCNKAWVVGGVGSHEQHGWRDFIVLGWKTQEATVLDVVQWDKMYIPPFLKNENQYLFGRWTDGGSDIDGWDYVEYGSIIPSSTEGMSCRRCGDFFPYAVPNRPDGISMICWSCRQGFIPSGW